MMRNVCEIVICFYILDISASDGEIEFRQRRLMESEELLILCFQRDWTSLIEINLLLTWLELGATVISIGPLTPSMVNPNLGALGKLTDPRKNLWLWACPKVPIPGP